MSTADSNVPEQEPEPLTLFECDQCTYREWHPAEQEPWLCPVCGYKRWSMVEGGEQAGSGSGSGSD